MYSNKCTTLHLPKMAVRTTPITLMLIILAVIAIIIILIRIWMGIWTGSCKIRWLIWGIPISRVSVSRVGRIWGMEGDMGVCMDVMVGNLSISILIMTIITILRNRVSQNNYKLWKCNKNILKTNQQHKTLITITKYKNRRLLKTNQPINPTQPQSTKKAQQNTIIMYNKINQMKTHLNETIENLYQICIKRIKIST